MLLIFGRTGSRAVVCRFGKPTRRTGCPEAAQHQLDGRPGGKGHKVGIVAPLGVVVVVLTPRRRNRTSSTGYGFEAGFAHQGQCASVFLVGQRPKRSVLAKGFPESRSDVSVAVPVFEWTWPTPLFPWTRRLEPGFLDANDIGGVGVFDEFLELVAVVFRPSAEPVAVPGHKRRGMIINFFVIIIVVIAAGNRSLIPLEVGVGASAAVRNLSALRIGLATTTSAMTISGGVCVCICVGAFGTFHSCGDTNDRRYSL